jgi:hypothetical protein
MQSAHQVAALDDRRRRVAPGGVLLQFRSLATILWLGQWNLLRHGHYGQRRGRLLGPACWRRPGFVPRQAWRSDLYAGRAARRLS